MHINRRHLIGASAAGVAGAVAMSPDAGRAAPPTSALGRDATHYGVRPGSADDQTKVLQRAIDDAARAQVPLALPPGVYRTGLLRLQSGTQLVGVRGATKFVFVGGASMLSGEGTNSVGLTGITLDGGGIKLPDRRGLVHCLGGRDIRITDCEIIGSGGNRIRNCDYSAVRGNSASNIQITGNSVSDVREVALYSEFSFEGAVIANNTVDGAALGVSVCNFNEGGRIAVVQGNVIRNLLQKRPIGTAPDDDAGIGIYVEADASVTGNVIENALSFGIIAGWGKYLRDVVISGNVVRNAFVGIGVSVVASAGSALVNNNMISEALRGAVVGLDHARPVTPDLSIEGAQRFAQVGVGTNAVRR